MTSIPCQQFSFLKEGEYNLLDSVLEELVRPFGQFVERSVLGASQLVEISAV
jgi:hypothetical protein